MATVTGSLESVTVTDRSAVAELTVVDSVAVLFALSGSGSLPVTFVAFVSVPGADGLTTIVTACGSDHASPSDKRAVRAVVVRWLAAVEAANDAFSNYRCLRRIVGLRHARSEIRQFFAGKFSFRIELIGKSNNTQLIFRIETFDLFDDLFSSHDLMLPHTAATFNLAVAPRKVSAVPSGTWARALALF